MTIRKESAAQSLCAVISLTEPLSFTISLMKLKAPTCLDYLFVVQCIWHCVSISPTLYNKKLLLVVLRLSLTSRFLLGGCPSYHNLLMQWIPIMWAAVAVLLILMSFLPAFQLPCFYWGSSWILSLTRWQEREIMIGTMFDFWNVRMVRVIKQTINLISYSGSTRHQYSQQGCGSSGRRPSGGCIYQLSRKQK